MIQAFRAECVRVRILRDPGSAHLLQCKHHRLLSQGRVSKAWVKPEQTEERAICDAYRQSSVRELREERGCQSDVCAFRVHSVFVNQHTTHEDVCGYTFHSRFSIR